MKVINEETRAKIWTEIKQQLNWSDIVWTKYGSETTDDLAEKITKKVLSVIEG